MTFNKLGVTLDLGESATGRNVIDLIPDRADRFSVRRLRGASVKDSGTSAETVELSNLICGSEKVTIIDVDKPRASLVEVHCEKSCRRWTSGNFASDNGVFVVKDECHKSQQMFPCPGLVAQSMRKHVMSLRDI